MRRVKNYNKNDFETLVKPANRPAKISLKWFKQIKVYRYTHMLGLLQIVNDSFFLESKVKPLFVKL